MKVRKHRSVDAAIRTLDEDERGKVDDWLRHLEHWETDERVRHLSTLIMAPDVYALDTTDDLKIFFKLDLPNELISIWDIAKPSRFKQALAASG